VDTGTEEGMRMKVGVVKMKAMVRLKVGRE